MSGLGVLNPAGALAFAAVGILILLHRRARRRREIPVPALFLWRRVAAAAPAPRRVRRDILFLLQLAVLLALIGAHLRPYRHGAAAAAPGGRLLLVLDASASMQAREPGGTRFALARGRARALVGDLGAADEVMLMTAAERPRLVLPWTTDHDDARNRLETLEALDTGTDLAAALEIAAAEARARPGTRAVVVTDVAPDASGAPPPTLAILDWIRIGETDDNAAVASLTVDAPPFAAAAEATATAVVRNYAAVPRRTVLEAHVDGTPWARRDLVLSPKAAEPVLLAGPPRAGVLVVALTGGDALPADDRAFAWIPPGRPLDAVLVTESPALAADLETLVAAIPGSRIEVRSPGAWAAGAPRAARAVVFDRVAPPATANALYVAPPADAPDCPSAPGVDVATIVDWDADHPVLAGLDDLPPFVFPSARLLAAPAWGAPVVLAAAGRRAFPLLLAGERDGRRIVCLAAALTPPLASSDRLPLLLLALGALRWLDPSPAPLRLETGIPMIAPSPLAVDGDHPGLHVVGDPPVLLAERTGEWRLAGRDGAQTVLANLFDDRESNIGRRPGGDRPARVRAIDAAPAPPREFARWLLLAAVVLLGVEWLAWLREVRA